MESLTMETPKQTWGSGNLSRCHSRMSTSRGFDSRCLHLFLLMRHFAYATTSQIARCSEQSLCLHSYDHHHVQASSRSVSCQIFLCGVDHSFFLDLIMCRRQPGIGEGPLFPLIGYGADMSNDSYWEIVREMRRKMVCNSTLIALNTYLILFVAPFVIRMCALRL